MPRKREQLRARDLVGENDGGVQHLHALRGEHGGLAQGGALLAFDAAGDFVEHLHAIEGVFADRGFAGEHDAVGLFVDGVGDIGDLGARGHGLGDHRFQHVGGDDDGLALGDAGLDGAALNHR